MITVEGYSGCDVRIVKRGPADYVVEKGSNDPKYVPRLLRQRDKQQAAFLANANPNVVIPRILYTKTLMLEEHDNIADAPSASPLASRPQGPPTSSSPPKPQACVIGMPFFHHTDTISFLSRASMDEVRILSDCLLETIDQNLRLCCASATTDAGEAAPFLSTTPPALAPLTSPCAVSVFTEKLADIVKVCTRNERIQAMEADTTGAFRVASVAGGSGGGGGEGPLSRICDVIVPSLVRYLTSKGQTIDIPMGACHGDFTLSNVLILTPHPNEPAMRFTVPLGTAPTAGAADGHHAVASTSSNGHHNNVGGVASPLRFAQPNSPFVTASSPTGRGGFRIALIDFLDSFVESPLADMAKICQDLKYGWTLRLLSTPKGAGAANGAGHGHAAPSSNAGGVAAQQPPLLGSAEERSVYARLSTVEARRLAPVSEAAARRRQRLLQCTAREIVKDTAAVGGGSGGGGSSAAGFAESLQSAAVQVFAAMHHMYEAMVARYGGYAWFRDYFLVFFIMNQLRVLQYAKDTAAGLYLYRSVEEEFKLFAQGEGRAFVE